MSKFNSDSFLPSGAIELPRRTFPFPRSDSMISPMMVPRSVPDYISSAHSSVGGSPSPHTFMSSNSPSQNQPISPPKTRSASAEDSTAALVEDWRTYTQKLRSQNEGERAHMAADRARMEEVMAEERALWDKEREIMKARIAELEAQLGVKATSSIFTVPSRPQAALSFASPGSNAASVTGSVDGSSRTIPQESGRNADGSPFYAPAPRHPSRTFDPSEAEEMRIDSITAPRESAIRVTSKELTPSDFGIQSPPSGHDLETINESPAESIDISIIQPGLEGVSIKASAVSPTFIAKVMSPRSPSKLSPDIKPPGRDIANRVRSPSQEEKDRMTLEVATQPENKRLTMHAGHTPNHSVSKFSAFFGGGDGESGNATPTQEHHETNLHRPSIAPEHPQEAESEHEGDEDKELSGPLGLTNEKNKDDQFIAVLTKKLEVEARKSADASPISENGRSLSPRQRRQAVDEEEKDEGPRLKLKPSTNFGRPLGSM
ncbi:hypothetical protein VTL71DRAFT_6436 [Oculimacula yallundae]|uniref:Uncharacterized protein n=1 Tax=Oculimacula yallundae TaxID=86028 RepID=A0ABR4BWY5_9HELO